MSYPSDEMIYQSAATRCAFACVVLTGMTVEQATCATWHLDETYVQTSDGAVFPLSQQAIRLLDGINPETTDIQAGMQALGLTVDDSHKMLARALWTTSDDTRFLQDAAALPQLTGVPLEMTYPLSIVGRLSPQDDEQFHHSQATLQAAVDWLLNDRTDDVSLWSKLLDGRFVFLIVSTGVSGLNLVHNLVMGRLLSPDEYGQLTFFITLLLIIGLIPAAMQTVAARYSAVYTARKTHSLLQRLHQTGVRYGWYIGIGLALAVLVLSPWLADVWAVRDAWLFLPIAAGIPFFLVTGTERGVLQGHERYYWLSAAYLAEGAVRLVVGVVLAWLLLETGWALDGAVWALGQSLFLTWLIAHVALRDKTKSVALAAYISDEQRQWLQLLGFTAMALLGQALITNSDFILVKTFFSATDAGLYAAVSVIGRIVYFGTLPLTVLIVPVISRKQALGESTRTLFILLMSSGALLCGGLFGLSLFFAPQIINLLYGAAYVGAAGLLPLYTIAAALFVMTNLLVTYRVALGNGNETWMPLLAGVAQIVGVMVFHASLIQVITVQIVVMSLLFISVGGYTLADGRSEQQIDTSIAVAETDL